MAASCHLRPMRLRVGPTPCRPGPMLSPCPARCCPAAPARTAASASRCPARRPSVFRRLSDSPRATVRCPAARSLPRTARVGPLPCAYQGTTGRFASEPAIRASVPRAEPATCASRSVRSFRGRCAYPDVSTAPAARRARPASPWPAAQWVSAAIPEARWAILVLWPLIVRRAGCASRRSILAGPTAIA